jgi:DNA gyrase subunit A
MEVVTKDGCLLVVTEHGFGKRTPLKEYTPKGRATGGVATINQSALDVTGKIAAVRVVQDQDDISIVSSAGVMLRLKVKDIRSMGRASRGVHLIGLQNGNLVASLGVIPADTSLADGEVEKSNGHK